MQRGFHERAQRDSTHVHIAYKGVSQRVQLYRDGTVRQSLCMKGGDQPNLQNERFIMCRCREIERSEFVLVTVLHLALVAQIEVGADGAVPSLPAHNVRLALVARVQDDRNRRVETVVQHHHGTVDGAAQLCRYGRHAAPPGRTGSGTTDTPSETLGGSRTRAKRWCCYSPSVEWTCALRR